MSSDTSSTGHHCYLSLTVAALAHPDALSNDASVTQLLAQAKKYVVIAAPFMQAVWSVNWNVSKCPRAACNRASTLMCQHWTDLQH